MALFLCSCCGASIDETAIDWKCDFCFALCPDEPDVSDEPEQLRRQAMRSLVGIWQWRLHLIKNAHEEDGFDPIDGARRAMYGASK